MNTFTITPVGDLLITHPKLPAPYSHIKTMVCRGVEEDLPGWVDEYRFANSKHPSLYILGHLKKVSDEIYLVVDCAGAEMATITLNH